jgi:hypothetical protein
MRAALFAVLIAASGITLAQGSDVGLVNLVSSEVSYSPAGRTPRRAEVFMRVREGDRFELPAGAQVRIVLFAAARQERWLGPAIFRVSARSSEPLAGKPAEVANLPPAAPQRIARMQELLQDAKLGGIQVRGGITSKQQASLDQQHALRDARLVYEQTRKQFPADDVTPELYLYAALHEYLLYEEMKSVVTEMLRKQPGNEDLKILDAWLASRTR